MLADANPQPLIPPKPVVPQAPGMTFVMKPPIVTMIDVGQPVGTTVNSKPNAIYNIGPISPGNEPPPIVASLGPNEVPTTSQQNPDNPAPIPVVGTVPPTATKTKVKAPSVAPATQSTKRILGLAVAVILLGWFFLGWSFRGIL